MDKMKKTDLRVGNLVSFYGKFEKVESIGTYGLSFDTGLTKYTSPNLKPIPLTEEILLKCGFKQEKGVMSYVLDDYSDIKIVYETLANHYRLYPYTYEILYLHQLQNLFYAIIGKELEVPPLL